MGGSRSVLFVYLSDHVRFVGIPRSFFAAKDGLYGAFLSGGQSPGKQARRYHRCHMATQTAAHIPFSPAEESRQANGIRMIK